MTGPNLGTRFDKAVADAANRFQVPARLPEFLPQPAHVRVNGAHCQ